MANEPEFLILKPEGGWLPAEAEDRLLGAAVKNYFDPLANSTPNKPMKHYDRKTYPLIEYKFDNLVLENNDVQARSGELVIKGLAHFFCRKSDEKLFNLKSKVIHVRRLTALEEFWKKVTAEDPDFTPKVTEWLGQKRMLGLKAKYDVYLVVGLLTCQDVEVAASNDEVRQRRRGFESPLGTIVEAAAASQGIPVITSGVGNVSGEVLTDKVKKTYFAAAGSGEHVFALQLKRITLRHGKLALGDEAPNVKANRRLGEGNPEDIILENIALEDWAAMVEEEEEATREEGKALPGATS
jgi:hypothetical protein